MLKKIKCVILALTTEDIDLKYCDRIMIFIPTCRHLVISLSNKEFLVVLNSLLPIISSNINNFS